MSNAPEGMGEYGPTGLSVSYRDAMAATQVRAANPRAGRDSRRPVAAAATRARSRSNSWRQRRGRGQAAPRGGGAGEGGHP